jgi:hypothetical protein
MLALIYTFCLTDATAANIQLVWTAPTTSADGSPLTDLASFNIKQSLVSGNYTGADITSVAAGVTSATPSPLVAGTTYYFVVTAIDSNGNESIPSNEVSYKAAMTPTSTPTPTPTATAQPTPTATPQPTPSVTPTSAPTPTATPQPTPSVTPTSAPTPAPTPQPTPGLTPTSTPTPTPSSSVAEAPQDFNGDGATDTALCAGGAYRIFTATDAAPAEGSVMTGLLAGATAVGAGDPSDLKRSVIIAVKPDSSTPIRGLQWFETDPLNGMSHLLFTFGRRGDHPLIGCQQSERLFPAVLTVTSKGKALKYKIGSRSYSMALSSNTMSVFCSLEGTGSSLFYQLAGVKGGVQMTAFNLSGHKLHASALFTPPAGTHYAVLPGTSTSPAVALAAYVSKGQLALRLLNDSSERWDSLSTPVTIDGIVDLDTGLQFSERWLAVRSKSGAVTFLILTETDAVASSSVETAIDPTAKERFIPARANF